MIAAGALTGVLGARWVYGFASALLVGGSITAYTLSRGITTQPAVARQQAA
jgi:hypothetical protein